MQVSPIRMSTSRGEVAVRLTGDSNRPPIILIHGFPSSSVSFRNVSSTLASDYFVVAPDMPGFGQTEPIHEPTFLKYAEMVEDVLAQLGIRSFHLFLHDFGAVVGLYLATWSPDRIRSLIVQNANAHRDGMGSDWSATIAYWSNPGPDLERQATAHLTLEGTRYQYVGGVPPEVARRIDPSLWIEDWRIMCLPGRLETQKRLVLDYRSHVARFAAIAEYLTRRQPPAILLWGRHDAFFHIDETLSWMKALPRMEAHILDGPHFLLETHAEECASLMYEFLTRVEIQNKSR